ncbi:MAG: SpoIIE family protein phosphatase, partial [Candidatus Marinimicrobia bacterium]|nr:SpoIIE family protein phosphatase [Candidatus Neomarinimicrobiota bacterium]
GPRIGRFRKGLPPIQGHSIPMATIGTIFLWFGWIGFNAGSTLGMNDSVPRILLNTNTSASFGGLTMLVLSWVTMKKPNVPHILNGVLAGLVSITANCHAVDTYQAALIGIIGATLYLLAFNLLVKVEIDDVVGAVPVHGVCGAWGTLAVAFFGHSDLLATGLGFEQQLIIQATGVVVCFILAFGCTYVFLVVANWLISLRVVREHELEGLNVTEHDASTEVLDLLYTMEKQKDMGDFSQRVYVEPHTEVGQIAREYNRVLDKVNAEMEISAAAKRVIEAAHKKMTDSINYASLIQYSIIPEEKSFKNNFSDYFTLWKPRDVIGGDVYLFTEFKDRDECLLMVIDCTGHGVPGAFVTMLVKAIERQVIGKINQDPSIDISPGWILGYFNKTIKKLLHQEDPKSICNAGFDGGILLYNRKNNLVKYAGAELPLFVIQDGVLNTIKGDRQSVGYRRSEFDFSFKDNNIKIDRGTYLYLTTDGYIDQNGGDNDFPFGKKQLKNILLKIHQENFSIQKEILLQKNIEYQQQEESTDDVTIVGLKIEPVIEVDKQADLYLHANKV